MQDIGGYFEICYTIFLFIPYHVMIRAGFHNYLIKHKFNQKYFEQNYTYFILNKLIRIVKSRI